MTDTNYQTDQPLDPRCPMGQIVDLMLDEARLFNNNQLAHTAIICRKRIHDKDEDVRRLVRAVIFQFAAQRSIDVIKMPWLEGPRVN